MIGFDLNNWTPEMRRIFPIIITGIVGMRTPGKVPERSAMLLGMKAITIASQGPIVSAAAIRIALMSGPVIHCSWRMKGATPARSAIPDQAIILFFVETRTSS